MSQTGIKERVSSMIASIANPPPPKDVTITDVIKLRRGGFTVIFKDKEVIKWLQDDGVEITIGIAPDTSITKRVYSILVPCVPLTFNPLDDQHLREVKESNNLPAGTIDKARWIKPAYRRALGQMAAHAIFTLKDVDITNTCIRDSLYICGVRIRPSRLKHKPMQCMKCRRWGHFANACTATVNTCGMCGGDHQTNECNSRDTVHCVSCKSDEHTQAGTETAPNSAEGVTNTMKTTQKTTYRTSPPMRTGHWFPAPANSNTLRNTCKNTQSPHSSPLNRPSKPPRPNLKASTNVQKVSCRTTNPPWSASSAQEGHEEQTQVCTLTSKMLTLQQHQTETPPNSTSPTSAKSRSAGLNV